MNYVYLAHSTTKERLEQNFIYSDRIANNERAMKRYYEDNNRLKSDYAKVHRTYHDASNPDMTVGTEERMWKNHKWVSRKRDDRGKWIYDYGYGYGKSDPEQIKKNSQRIKSLSDENKSMLKAAKRNDEDDLLEHPMADPIKAAQIFIDRLFKKPFTLISL